MRDGRMTKVFEWEVLFVDPANLKLAKQGVRARANSAKSKDMTPGTSAQIVRVLIKLVAAKQQRYRSRSLLDAV